MCNTRETIKRSWLYGLYAEQQHMLNAHTPASTRVTTHLALRYKGERRELARGMMTYFMQSETVQ